MIVADLSKSPLTEVVVAKDSDLEKELTKKIPAGFTLTYPLLQLQDGTVLTQTTAIVEYLAETGEAAHLLGKTDFERS